MNTLVDNSNRDYLLLDSNVLYIIFQLQLKWFTKKPGEKSEAGIYKEELDLKGLDTATILHNMGALMGLGYF